MEYQGAIILEIQRLVIGDQGRGAFRDHDIALQIPLKMPFCVNETHPSSLRRTLKGGEGVSQSFS
jgi:hypothetical protein